MLETLMNVRRVYLDNPNGVPDDEIMTLFNVSRATVSRWRHELGAYAVRAGGYCVDPTLADVMFAEAVTRRIEGRTIVELARRESGG